MFCVRGLSGLEGKWNVLRPQHDRLKKLAGRLDLLIEKDERRARHESEIGELRQKAAAELYTICAGFVGSVNSLLQKARVELDPSEYSAEAFRPHDPNLFQIHVRGRIMPITFEAPDEIVSTEHFRVPYVLEGAIRCFNQALLDREAIEEQLLFFCLEKNRKAWRYFNGRTYHSGLFDEEYLVSLMEQLL
jgi:hypothetical protein